jgi:hypothetical protein
MEDESSQSNGLMDVTLFDMATISLSTANFATSSKLGEGGFGAVYKVNIAILLRGYLMTENDNNCCETHGRRCRVNSEEGRWSR